jgi:3-hydroxyacyl-CoA dehydrogenase
VADALEKLVLTSSGEAALATADLVVEAITENLPLKQEHRDHALKFFLWKMIPTLK